MAIYVEQGQANNDEHLLSLLKNFLNYYGWEDVSVAPSNFTVTKLINNFRWYWHFDVGFTNRMTTNVFGLDYGYGTSPNVIYKRRMLIEWRGTSGLVTNPNFQTLRNATLNYYFILNIDNLGETLILVIYQNNVFLTGYLGFINLLIPNNTMQTIHHAVVPCYIGNGFTSDYYYSIIGNLIFAKGSSLSWSEVSSEWANSYFYYNSNYPNLRSQSGGNGFLSGSSDRRTAFNRNGLYSSLIPEILILQPIPFYVFHNNQWSYIGNLKGIYTCISYKNRPFTETYGSKTYLFVPLLHNTISGVIYTWTIKPEFTYAIVIAE